MAKKKIVLVLGGGGTKCLSYIGILRVLEAKGIEIAEYVGTSMGAFVAAVAASGLTSSQMAKIALPVSRRDVLDLNMGELMMYQTRANSVFRGEKLEALIKRIVPVHDFALLRKPLFINSVDLVTGRNRVFGSKGYQTVSVPDAVYASCAIPGVFAAKKMGKGHFVDGGVVDNLPIRFAESRKPDLIIAAMPSMRTTAEHWHIENEGGIVSTVLRANSLMVRNMMKEQIKECRVPLVMIEPDLSENQLFEFSNINKMIFRGEHAAIKAIEQHRFLRSHRGWGLFGGKRR